VSVSAVNIQRVLHIRRCVAEWMPDLLYVPDAYLQVASSELYTLTDTDLILTPANATATYRLSMRSRDGWICELADVVWDVETNRRYGLPPHGSTNSNHTRALRDSSRDSTNRAQALGLAPIGSTPLSIGGTLPSRDGTEGDANATERAYARARGRDWSSGAYKLEGNIRYGEVGRLTR
jgi:hypothetical protein